MRWGLNFIGNQDCNWSPADKGGACQIFFSPIHFYSLPLPLFFLFFPLQCLHFASWSLPGCVEGQGQCRVVQYRGGKREKRQKRRGRKERGDGDGGREEIKNGGERGSKKERRVEKQERGRGRSQGQCEDSVVLWVGQRHSRSHLCANQPFGWLMRCQLDVCVCVCGKPFPLLFWLQNEGGWSGGVTVCVCVHHSGV